jgi:ABC-2 type transport system permease protein
VNIAVTTLHPVPSRVEMIGAMRATSNEAAARGSRLLAKYYEDHPELAPAADAGSAGADFAVRSQAVQEEVERSVAPVLARHDAQLTRQQALVDRLRFLSPAIVALEALNDVAGTGPARHRYFLAQVDAYHREWLSFFVPRVMRRESLKAADYDAIPRFAFREEPAGAVASRAAIGLLGLVVPTLLIGVPGLAALRRYPVAG